MGDTPLAELEGVRTVVCGFNKSHNEMLHPERRRSRNFGRRYREEKAETSIHDPIAPYSE